MQKHAKGHKYQKTYESNKHNGNRDKTQTREEAPWFLSNAGSPKGKMQLQEEGFGETQGGWFRGTPFRSPLQGGLKGLGAKGASPSEGLKGASRRLEGGLKGASRRLQGGLKGASPSEAFKGA